MYQPTEFNDGDHIIIINNVPYYHYTGPTYKDKLKNGISLDYVFELEDDCKYILFNKKTEKVFEEYEEREKMKEQEKVFEEIYRIKTMIDYEEYYGLYEQNEYKTIPSMRKGKWTPFKKRNARNMKKNTIRQKGYADKLFTIEQHLSDNIDIDDANSCNEEEYLEYNDDDNISERSCYCIWCRGGWH